MNNLSSLEKIINSELTTKIKSSLIKFDQIYLNINHEDLLDCIIFLKTNNETKFQQLVDITAVDYPNNKDLKSGDLLLVAGKGHEKIQDYQLNLEILLQKKIHHIQKLQLFPFLNGCPSNP